MSEPIEQSLSFDHRRFHGQLKPIRADFEHFSYTCRDEIGPLFVHVRLILSSVIYTDVS